jgi:hypothetical protein
MQQYLLKQYLHFTTCFGPIWPSSGASVETFHTAYMYICSVKGYRYKDLTVIHGTLKIERPLKADRLFHFTCYNLSQSYSELDAIHCSPQRVLGSK